MSTTSKKPILYTEEGEEIALPSHKIVCYRCGGEGTITNPDVDDHGISAEEMHELGDDFRADYFRGVYDIVCVTCGGANVVDEVDRDACTPEQLAAWDAQEREIFESYALSAAERRMGA